MSPTLLRIMRHAFIHTAVRSPWKNERFLTRRSVLAQTRYSPHLFKGAPLPDSNHDVARGSGFLW